MSKLPVPISKGDLMPVQKEHFRVVNTKKGKKAVRINPGFHKTLLRPNKNIEAQQKQTSITTPQQPKIRMRPKPIPRVIELPGPTIDTLSEMTHGSLRLPTITWPGYKETQLMSSKVPEARMMQYYRDKKEFQEYATDEEVLEYLNHLSYNEPLTGALYDIWDNLRHKSMGLNVLELQPTTNAILIRIKRWIRKKQWEAFKKYITSGQYPVVNEEVLSLIRKKYDSDLEALDKDIGNIITKGREKLRNE